MAQIYINHVREGLAELASERRQGHLWLATEGPEIGSFDEAVEQTFDDSGLGDVLEKPVAVQALGAKAVRSLQELERALSSVDRTLDTEDLIDSQSMENVRVLAAAALDAIRDLTP